MSNAPDDINEAAYKEMTEMVETYRYTPEAWNCEQCNEFFAAHPRTGGAALALIHAAEKHEVKP